MKFKAGIKNEIGEAEEKIADLQLEIEQIQARIGKMKEFEAKAAAFLHLAKELVSEKEVLAGDSFRVLTEDVMDILAIGPEETQAIGPLVQPEVPSDGTPNITSACRMEVQYEVDDRVRHKTDQKFGKVVKGENGLLIQLDSGHIEPLSEDWELRFKNPFSEDEPEAEKEPEAQKPGPIAAARWNLLNRLRTIKAISLYQPWANLLVTVNPKTGQPFKQFETRDWNTDFRGKLLIHSCLKDNMELFTQSDEIAEQLGIEINFENLPRGMAIAVADLSDVLLHFPIG